MAVRQYVLAAAAAGVLLASGCTDAASLSGRASVIDGDTIEIGGEHIRMVGIDAPESTQTCKDENGRAWRCGTFAARALDEMIAGKTVTCAIDPKDRQDKYGRVLGLCSAGGLSLSVEMARQGWAVAYLYFLDYQDGRPRSYKAAILAAEAEAAAAHRNIWRGPFDLPWEWRAAHRHP